MSDVPSREIADLPGTLVRRAEGVHRAEQACDGFEAAWKAGQRPRLEDHLAAVPEAERPALLRELVLLEVDYRRLAGEQPGADELLARFPGLDRAWLDGVLSATGSSATLVLPGVSAAPDLPVIPGFEVLGELGRGGMGVVYWAWQPGPNRPVALKMILTGAHASAEQRSRFRTEAEAVGRLQHPNIVQIFQIAEQGGRPFLAMEYVEGGSLAQKLTGTPLPSGPSAELAETLARAVQSAHERGIVHRDLTPANVLLTADGAPKITDFGLAKLIIGAGAAQTQTGEIMGTPSYMAPEQASGQTRETGPAADVYALGAIFYELLTGRPPFRGETPLETLLQVRTEEPVPPRRLQPKVPRDLETICLKCLQKAPDKRYASAAALADDLQRYRQGEPIRARPTSRMERAVRWCRRHPGMAALTATVAMLLLTLAVGASGAALWLRQQLYLTQQAGRQARQAELQAKQGLYQARLGQAQASRWSGQAGRRFASLEALTEAAELLRLLNRGPEAALELRNEAVACMTLVDLRLERPRDPLPSEGRALAIDAGFRRYARGDEPGTVTVYRVEDDQELFRLPGRFDLLRIPFLRFSSDGRFLALRHEGPPQMQIDVWDLDRRDLVRPRLVFAAAQELDFSPDSRRVAVGYLDGSVRLHDLTADGAGQLLSSAPTPVSQFRIRFNFQGTRLAVGDIQSHRLRVWDPATGKVVRELDCPAAVRALAWRPDGRQLAAACDRSIYLWDVEAKTWRVALTGSQGSVRELAFSHAGDQLASNAYDGILRLWDVRTGKQLVGLRASGAPQFSRNDRRLALQSAKGLEIFELARGHECLTLYGRAHTLDISPDGRLLAIAGDDTVRFRDLVAGKDLAPLALTGARGATFDPAGRYLLTHSACGLYHWPITRTGPQSLRLGPPQAVSLGVREPLEFVSPSRDGRTTAVRVGLGDASRAALLDVEKRSVTAWLSGQRNLWMTALSPDGQWVASGAWHGRDIRIWETATGRLVDKKPLRDGYSASIAFSPDGKWLVTCDEKEYRSWGVGSWRFSHRVARESVEGDIPGSMAFTRDGRMLAITHSQQVIKLIDPATGKEFVTLEAPEPLPIYQLCFSPDGSHLAAWGGAGVTQLWDLRRIRQQLQAIGLDWPDPPPAPAGNDAEGKVLRIETDPGELLDREKYSLILAFFPFHAEAYYRRGLAYGRFNQADLARVDFSRAAFLKPELADAYYQRGMLEAQQGRLPEAVADFNRCLDLDPKQADAYEQRARAYTQLQQWDKALEDYSKALQHRADDWQLWHGRGYARWRLGGWDQALTDFSQGLKLNPRDPMLWSFRGLNLVELGCWQEAVADFSHALERNDGAGWVWGGRGLAHAALGQWDKAEADFTGAAQLEPGNSYLWYERALAHLAFGNRDDYRKVCADALAHFGKTTDPMEATWLASVCALVPNAVTDASRPVQLARRAVAGRPQGYAAARALGAALLRAGDLEAAVRELSRASALQKDAPTTWLLLAMAHHRLGHAGEARQWLDRGLHWIEQASRRRAGAGGPLSAWQRIPWGERLGLLFLRLEAEPLINGTPPWPERDYPDLIKKALAGP
jgi:tetratricopeptide (TPR) repeat protein/WD40 repeat protein